MVFSKPADGVTFADDSLEKTFNSLDEEEWLKKAIRRAIADFKENAFCGEHIKKEQVPKVYLKKYGINNLWWYPLPKGWRLVYSIVTPSNSELLAVIIDYYNHKKYERKFGY